VGGDVTIRCSLQGSRQATVEGADGRLRRVSSAERTDSPILFLKGKRRRGGQAAVSKPIPPLPTGKDKRTGHAGVTTQRKGRKGAATLPFFKRAAETRRENAHRHYVLWPRRASRRHSVRDQKDEGMAKPFCLWKEMMEREKGQPYAVSFQDRCLTGGKKKRSWRRPHLDVGLTTSHGKQWPAGGKSRWG